MQQFGKKDGDLLIGWEAATANKEIRRSQETKFHNLVFQRRILQHNTTNKFLTDQNSKILCDQKWWKLTNRYAQFSKQNPALVIKHLDLKIQVRISVELKTIGKRNPTFMKWCQDVFLKNVWAKHFFCLELEMKIPFELKNGI